MRKKLGYLFVAICVALLVLYFFRYKRALKIEDKIPKTATEVVHINVRQIEQHLLFDALKNPLKYIDLKGRKKDKVSLRRTISIPRNMLFFTNTSTLKSAWFSSFISLKKRDAFERYLLQEGFQEIKNNELGLFGKGRLVIGILHEKMMIAFKKRQNESVVDALQDLFQETNFYQKDDGLLKLISNSESDLSYVNTADNFLEGNFKNDLFEIKGNVIFELFNDISFREPSENTVGFIAAQINNEHPFFKSFVTEDVKRKFDDVTKLSLDSIVNKWNGNLVLNLKSVDKRIDTIVTYEYDDDFNKLEKKSIQELSVPDVRFELGDKDSLYSYFSHSNAIKTVDGDTLFTSIPLYKMFARNQDDGLHIFTQKQPNKSANKEVSYKLKAFLDTKKYMETPLEFSSIPAKNSRVRLIENVSAELSINDEFLMQVRLRAADRNFIGQFIKPD